MAATATARPACRALTTAALMTAMGVAAAAPAAADERHRVEPGDTVSGLAHRYDSTIGAIVAANNLDSRARIYVGTTVVIPTDKPATASSHGPATYTVKAGDTLSEIAQRHGTTVAAIARENSLANASFITIGQRLSIPGALAKATTAAKTTTASSTTTYTVKAGDTLSEIAQRHGTTVGAIARASTLANASLIRVGQRLTIPAGTGATTTAALVGDTFLGRTYPSDVVAAANVNKATLLARGVPSREHMQSLIVSTARRYGVDPALAQAIAYQESGFNMTAVSPANAIGVMQVIPTSGEWASDMAGRRLDLLDPEDNVLAGVLILRSLTGSFSQLNDAIAGYYQGAAAVRRDGYHPDTVDYVASVRALMGRF